MPEYRAPGTWIVVADAGAAGPLAPTTWGPQAAVWMLHWRATDREPVAEGCSYVGRQSSNRAEHLAVIAGLRFVADAFEILREWGPAPVHVVTDSALVVDLQTGRRTARDLRGYADAITQEAQRVEALTGSPVRFVHAGARESRRAHTTARLYRDQRLARVARLWP